MKRKIIKQGHNTLTITLPKRWAENKGLKGGDEINIEEIDDELRISGHDIDVKRSLRVQSKDLEWYSTAKLISACYELGLDKLYIELGKDKSSSWYHGKVSLVNIIHKFTDRMIGYEVTSQTERKIQIENMSQPLVKYDIIMAKMFSMVIQFLTNYIDIIEEGKEERFKEGDFQHDNITRFASLCIRLIHSDRTFSKTEQLNHCIIISLIDKSADFLRNVYRHTNLPDKKRTTKLCKTCISYVELLRSFYFNYDIKKVNELDEIKGKIYKALKTAKTQNQYTVATHIVSFIEVLHSTTKSRIMIEIDKTAV